MRFAAPCSLIALGIALVVAAPRLAYADDLALYDFSPPQTVDSKDTDPNSVAFAINAGTNAWSVATFSGFGAPAPSLALGSLATSLSQAQLSDSYALFRLSPKSGFRLDLTGFSMDVAGQKEGRDGNPFIGQAFVFSSADGFTDPITAITVIDTTADVVNSPFVTTQRDLSGLALFQGLTTPTEFRVYLAQNTAETSGFLLLDNIRVTGHSVALESAAAPDAGTLPLLLLGLAFGSGHRLIRRIRRAPVAPPRNDFL